MYIKAGHFNCDRLLLSCLAGFLMGLVAELFAPIEISVHK